MPRGVKTFFFNGNFWLIYGLVELTFDFVNKVLILGLVLDCAVTTRYF